MENNILYSQLFFFYGKLNQPSFQLASGEEFFSYGFVTETMQVELTYTKLLQRNETQHLLSVSKLWSSVL